MDWLMGIGRNRLGAGTSKKSGTEESREKGKAYLLDKYTGELLDKISKAELRETVPVPAGVDINEWLATNTLSFYNHINQIYSTITDYCTAVTCNNLSSGNTSFTWVDEKGKKIRMSAHQYLELVIISVEKLVTDEGTFPTKYDQEFPIHFQTTIKRIFRLMFHVLGHIYTSHFNNILELGELLVLNTVFVHFMYFQMEHNLIDAKELQSLEDLVQAFNL
ncbi:MOB kinase activator 2-like isoform X2 [Rhopilema esculentum]|uniref:MOB kinase activator 2-like isoform X2 n=1 Tax=Rhopilema esculentum TaxID=499914 RepID=UPI0031D123C1